MNANTANLIIENGMVIGVHIGPMNTFIPLENGEGVNQLLRSSYLKSFEEEIKSEVCRRIAEKEASRTKAIIEILSFLKDKNLLSPNTIAIG